MSDTSPYGASSSPDTSAASGAFGGSAVGSPALAGHTLTGSVVRRTNVLSIVALVLSVIGFTIIGIILGFVGLSQIKKTGESGRGLAIAAVVVGFIELILGVVIAVAYAAVIAGASVSGGY